MRVTDEQIRALVCDICGKPAACVGRYEDMTDNAPACDECCGHGCEDGHCEPLFCEDGDIYEPCRDRAADAIRAADSATPPRVTTQEERKHER